MYSRAVIPQQRRPVYDSTVYRKGHQADKSKLEIVPYREIYIVEASSSCWATENVSSIWKGIEEVIIESYCGAGSYVMLDNRKFQQLIQSKRGDRY
jgi:hypothetical protein